jgi:hypothetical protein
MAGTLTSTGSTTIKFAILQFAPHLTISYEVSLISDHSKLKNTEMIIGRDLIKDLGLVLDYSTDTPSINGKVLLYPSPLRAIGPMIKFQNPFPSP